MLALRALFGDGLQPDAGEERNSPSSTSSPSFGSTWSNFNKLREGIGLVKQLPERFAAAIGIRNADTDSDSDDDAGMDPTGALRRRRADRERARMEEGHFTPAVPADGARTPTVPREPRLGDIPGQLAESERERQARHINGLLTKHWSISMKVEYTNDPGDQDSSDEEDSDEDFVCPAMTHVLTRGSSGSMWTRGATGSMQRVRSLSLEERRRRILRTRLPTPTILTAWETVRLGQHLDEERAAIVGSCVWAFFPYPHDIDSLERVCVRAVSREDAACQTAELLKSLVQRSRSSAFFFVELKAGVNAKWHSVARRALDPEDLLHTQVAVQDKSLVELRDQIFRLPHDSLERKQAVRMFKHKVRVVKWSGRELLEPEPEKTLPGEQTLSLVQALQHSEIIKTDAICLIDGVLTEVSNMIVCQWRTSADEEPQALSATFAPVKDVLAEYLRGLRTFVALSFSCKSIKRMAALLHRLVCDENIGVPVAVQARALDELEALQPILASDIGRFSQLAEMAETLRKVMKFRADGMDVPFSKQDMVVHLRLLLRDMHGALQYPINLNGSLVSAFLCAGFQFLDRDDVYDTLLETLNGLCPALKKACGRAAMARLTAIGRDLATLQALAEDITSQVPLDASVRLCDASSCVVQTDTASSVLVYGVTGDPDEA